MSGEETVSGRPVLGAADTNVIDVWIVNHDDEKVLQQHSCYRGWLSKAEQEKNAAYYFSENRRQHLAGNALTRSGLSSFESSIDEREWRFDQTEHGKPFVVGPERALARQFNISHTEGLVVGGFSSTGAVGIDVESIARQSDCADLARSYFAPEEVAELLALPDSEKRRRFFAYWTLKESCIKAQGMGLGIPLDSFWFSLRRPGVIEFNCRSQHLVPAKNWRFWLVDCGDQHLISIAQKCSEKVGEPRLRFARVVPGKKVEYFSPKIQSQSSSFNG